MIADRRVLMLILKDFVKLHLIYCFSVLVMHSEE